MRRTKIIYWIATGLLIALMVLSSFFDITRSADAVALMKHLGYPLYFMSFIGAVRLLGIAAILIPGYPKITEWAYAGLAFDMIGAVYSHLSVGDPASVWMPAFIGLVLVTVSYIYYHKKFDEFLSTAYKKS